MRSINLRFTLLYLLETAHSITTVVVCGIIDTSCFVIAAVSAPLLDVLASAAVEQPPLEMPSAASALEPQTNADSVAEAMPTVSADVEAVQTAPVTSTPVSDDVSLLGADQLAAAAVDMATARFLLYTSCLLFILSSEL